MHLLFPVAMQRHLDLQAILPRFQNCILSVGWNKQYKEFFPNSAGSLILLTKLATQTSTGLLFYTMIHIGTGRSITLKIYCSIASNPIQPKLSISESSASAPFLHWEAGVCKKLTLNHTKYSLFMLLKVWVGLSWSTLTPVELILLYSHILCCSFSISLHV